MAADLKRGNPSKFLTLTVNPEVYGGPEDRARRLADAWRAIVKRLKRMFPQEQIAYFVVFERTQQGEPHLHVLGRWPYVPQREFSRWMNDLMQAPIVWIEAVRSDRGVAKYVSKYLSKAPQRWGTMKRYWRSQNWAAPRPKEDRDPLRWLPRWERVETPYDRVWFRYYYGGWQMVVNRPWYFEARAP